MRGDLLCPRERRVERPGPGHRHLVVSLVRPPHVIEILELVGDRDRRSVASKGAALTPQELAVTKASAKQAWRPLAHPRSLASAPASFDPLASCTGMWRSVPRNGDGVVHRISAVCCDVSGGMAADAVPPSEGKVSPSLGVGLLQLSLRTSPLDSAKEADAMTTPLRELPGLRPCRLRRGEAETRLAFIWLLHHIPLLYFMEPQGNA
jgi:hypothetical protein